MKNKILKAFLLTCCSLFIAKPDVFAQYVETFDGLTMTSVTTGTSTVSMSTTLPNGWSQINNDGFTVNSSLSYMGSNGWIARRLSLDGITVDTVAMSVSWYSSTVANPTSDDYLISPQLTVPNPPFGIGGIFLLWQGVALDANYPDGYEVRVSTTGNTVSDFQNGTVVYSTTAENASGWAQHAANLSSFTGQSIYVAFRNNSTDKYVLLIDDIRLQLISNTDAELVSLNVDRFAKTNTNVFINGTIKNNGQIINSLTLNWNDGSGVQSTTLSGLNIAPYATYSFSHPIPFNKPSVNEYTLNVGITAVNGGVTESNVTNNYATTKISTVANLPHKNVVIESGNGTWNGWTPRGYVAIEDLYFDAAYNQNFIGIDVHNGSTDPMLNTAYDNANNISGYPGCNINRKLKDQSVTTALYQQYVDTYKLEVAPAEVSGTTLLNATSRLLTIDASATFKTTLTDEVRFAVVLVEDSVHGTASGYAQTNYYSSTVANLALTGAGHNWQIESSPVPAALMWYNHVGRELIGGYNGEVASIPSSLNNGTIATHTFSYTVPTAYNLNHLKAVIMLVNPLTSEIYNAVEVPVSVASITASGPTSICPGASVTLTAPSSNIYQWQLNGVNITGANSSTYNASAAGQYSVICNINGNVATVGPVNVSLLPTTMINAYANPSNTICAGNTITLYGTGANYYSWSNGITDGVPFVPSGAGVLTYQLQATDANGCVQTMNYSINVQSPQITQQPSDALVVVGNTASFQVGVSATNAMYQWQVNMGTGWTNLSNLGIYSGVNTNTLTISNTQLIQNNTAYQCIVTVGSCSSTTNMAMLYVSTAVGLEAMQQDKFTIVPNPVKDVCVITPSSALANVRINVMDVTGKIVFTDVVKQLYTYELNTSSYSNGIYFVEITSDKQVFKKKIIKE